MEVRRGEWWFGDEEEEEVEEEEVVVGVGVGVGVGGVGIGGGLFVGIRRLIQNGAFEVLSARP